MDDALIPLLWCGGIGWFLLTFLLASGDRRGWLRNLLVTAFCWLIMIDPVAISLGIVVPILRRTDESWRFICSFVVLPYLLCVLRLGWLRMQRLKTISSINSACGDRVTRG